MAYSMFIVGLDNLDIVFVSVCVCTICVVHCKHALLL